MAMFNQVIPFPFPGMEMAKNADSVKWKWPEIWPWEMETNGNGKTKMPFISAFFAYPKGAPYVKSVIPDRKVPHFY